jgi:hypothetical protein
MGERTEGHKNIIQDIEIRKKTFFVPEGQIVYHYFANRVIRLKMYQDIDQYTK